MDGARECVGHEREDGEHRHRRDQPGADRVGRVPVRSRPRQQSDTGGDGGHARDLAAADGLVEHAVSDHEQDDQARRQRGLDEREWDQQQRADLRDPAEKGEQRPDDPARLGHEPAQQREPQVVLVRGLARLERLQPDGGRVQHRSREGKSETRDDEHEQGAR